MVIEMRRNGGIASPEYSDEAASFAEEHGAGVSADGICASKEDIRAMTSELKAMLWKELWWVILAVIIPIAGLVLKLIL